MVKFQSIPISIVYIAFTIISFQLTSGFLVSIGDLSQMSSLLQENTGKEVRLISYRGLNIDSAIATSFSGDNAKHVMIHIDLTKPMALYIHGFQESPSNESIRTVADAYLRRGDQNFVLVDWSDYAYDNYLSDLFQVKRIARSLARVLDGFVQNGLPSEALHIVGHSMGGQMAGFIGKYTNFLVARITGLDPASPGYYQFGADHLNPSNAKFVDVIHTDGGLYGAYPATGTADCYPNGGTRPQPGCPLFGVLLSPTDLCSHWRSWRFWAESLLNERVFLAVKCSSYASFLSGKCRKNEACYCGFGMPNTALLLAMLAVLLCGLFGCSKVTTDDIFYRVFNGTTDHYIDVPSGNSAKLHAILDISKPTQFYIHGWQEKCDNISAVTVTSALLSRGASNVCCLDWRKPARDNYISAGNSTQEIAEIFAKDISGMCDLGFQPGGMNLLGFSLGAHIAGFTGKNLQIAGYPNLGQITALDAALPLMYPPMCLDCRHLEPTDADMVWAIHTCGGTYGVLEPTAQVDIYPNYGTPIQKGCPIVPEKFDVTQIMPTHRCNHDRSWKLYADAIMNPNSQICVKCDSSLSFSANFCANNTRISIGMDMPENTSGLYYYMTNEQSPYGRGETGINPSSSQLTST